MAFTPVTSTTHKIDDYILTAVVAGVTPVPIIAAGDDSELFSYERDNETWNKKHDQSGSGHFSYNPARGGKITVKTLHTNKSANSQFQALLSVAGIVGELVNPGNFDFLITDNQGNAVIRANKCKIERQPNGSRGKEIGTIEWTIIAVELLVDESGLNID